MKKVFATVVCLIALMVMLTGCEDKNKAVFKNLAGVEWSYYSGAGAWSSDMQIKADGTFTCNYHDSDMGDCGDDYPDGTMYYGSFSGRMSVAEQVDANTWKIRVNELKMEPAKEKIEDGVRYIPTDCSGLSEGDVMKLYASGTPADVLSEDMQFWAHVMDQEQTEKLENWFLCSEANDSGFVGYMQQQ